MTLSIDTKKTLLKILILILSVIMFLVAFHLFPTVAKAQPIDVCDTFGGCLAGLEQYNTPESNEGVVLLVRNLTWFVTWIAAPIAVVFAILGGYKMMTANGDDKQYANGLDTLKFSLFGIAIIVLATTIVGLTVGLVTSNWLGGGNTPNAGTRPTNSNTRTNTGQNGAVRDKVINPELPTVTYDEDPIPIPSDPIDTNGLKN